MKQLQDILFGVGIREVFGNMNRAIRQISLDSRTVQANDLFIAIGGNQSDGHQFINQAIEAGAVAIVCEQLPDVKQEQVTYCKVDNSRVATAVIAANFYDHPSTKLKLLGVTGTNGKTTVVTLLHQLYTHLGVTAGLLSTIENKIGTQKYDSTLTTPDAISMNQLLHEMVEAGCDICFMEVSSHAVDQHRVDGLQYAGGLFTNITRDHLDYHKSFKAYIEAKQKFFTQLSKSAFALYNEDDSNGPIMVQNSKAHKASFGLKSFSDYRVRILEESLDGLLLNIQGTDVYTQLTGEFNALNLLAAYAVAMELGEDEQQVLQLLSALKGAPGRFEKVVSKSHIIGIVDYSHTPDSLEKVLQSINKLRTGIEQLITVVGCGGNRDTGKRPIMGGIASELSDKVILTSDNPRNENPSEIIEQMADGVKITQKQKVLTVVNRRDAIRTAVSMAKPDDIILVAGKGHEQYQEINGERFPFDDRTVLREAYEEFKQ